MEVQSHCSEACKERYNRILQEKQHIEYELYKLQSQQNNSTIIQFAYLDQQINELKKIICEKDAEIVRLHEKINRMTDRINVQDMQIIELKHENAELKHENANLKNTIVDMKKTIIRLENTVDELRSGHESSIIGQIAYEFCELATLYITQLDDESIEDIFNKNAYQINWNRIKSYVENNGSTEMKMRMNNIEGILKNEQIHVNINSYIIQLKGLRFNTSHPNIFNIAKEKITSIINNHQEITTIQKHIFGRILNVVHEIKNKYGDNINKYKLF